MTSRLFFYPLLLVTIVTQAQYKNDNTKYKTVFLEDLCKTLYNNSDYILLDVRSKGEYCDTSSFASLNIGHLKDAINIDVQELPGRLNELKADKDKPIFVYCSHSQRSRRASTTLADSGFTNVFNINGGLTTFNLLKENGISCASYFYQTANKFNILSPLSFFEIIKKDKNVFILDVRKDSVFNGTSTDEKLNSYGKLKNAVNIPLSSLPNSLQMVPRSSKIIIVDDFGNESPKAAATLTDNGYKDVNILFNGMDRWAGMANAEVPERENYWIHPSAYRLLASDDFNDLATKNSLTLLLDIRTADEFANKAKDYWRNIGNIKKAVNIPLTDLSSRMKELEANKNNPIVIYSFGTGAEAFKAARLLADNGFQKVNILLGGLFNLRWRAANIKGKSQLKDWVENIPEINQ